VKQILASPENICWQRYENLQSIPVHVSRFLTSTRHGSTFQNPQWYLCTEDRTDRFMVLAALQRGEPVFASLVMRRWVPGTSFYAGIVPRGPVFDDLELALSIWDDYERQLTLCNLCSIEIHPFWERLQAGKLRSFLIRRGYAFMPENQYHTETLTLDLTPSEEAIFNGLKGSRRNLIRKAMKMGISVRPVRNSEEMRKFWEMYHQMCLNKEIGCWPRKRFESVRRYSQEFPSQCACLIGWLNGDLVGGNIILRHGDIAEVTRGGGSTRCSNGVPKTDLILWESILWAKRAGAKTYDFGGITPDAEKGTPEWGINRFKMEFTRNHVSLLEPMEKVFNANFYGIFSSLKRFKKMVLKRLPIRMPA
jgi:lipid II:glycine glycyltransferase (peptidoglycan interpeptide bridge formation enzyme)